jgi:RHS repeat-associated protein
VQEAGRLIYKRQGSSYSDEVYMFGSRFARVDGTIDGNVHTESARFWYHTDHHGTAEAMTNSSGATVWQANYTGHGELLSKTGSIAGPAVYTGKEFDEAVGLYNFNIRWYDPDLGRFINEDPARDGINWHIYCSNNPVRFMDAWGLESDDFGSSTDSYSSASSNTSSWGGLGDAIGGISDAIGGAFGMNSGGGTGIGGGTRGGYGAPPGSIPWGSFGGYLSNPTERTSAPEKSTSIAAQEQKTGTNEYFYGDGDFTAPSSPSPTSPTSPSSPDNNGSDDSGGVPAIHIPDATKPMPISLEMILDVSKNLMGKPYKKPGYECKDFIREVLVALGIPPEKYLPTGKNVVEAKNELAKLSMLLNAPVPGTVNIGYKQYSTKPEDGHVVFAFVDPARNITTIIHCGRNPANKRDEVNEYKVAGTDPNAFFSSEFWIGGDIQYAPLYQ